MRLLLDTHAFLWADSDPARLSIAAARALVDPANDVHLSVVSVWEVAIKARIGKLTLRSPLPAILADQQANGIAILDVTLPHALAVESLPLHHRDPFDRLLVAQAACESARLVSADPLVARYGVPILW